MAFYVQDASHPHFQPAPKLKEPGLAEHSASIGSTARETPRGRLICFYLHRLSQAWGRGCLQEIKWRKTSSHKPTTSCASQGPMYAA